MKLNYSNYSNVGPNVAAAGRASSRSWRYILGVLLLLDALFIAFYLLYSFLNDTTYDGFLNNALWSLGRDGGYAELYGYAKAAFAAALLLLLYLRRPALTYLGWGLALLFIVLDDAFSLHEALGAWLMARGALPTLLGVAPHVYAEMVLWGAVGLGVLGLVALGYLREPGVRAFSRRLLGCLVAIFFFGGIIDVVHLLAVEDDWGRLAMFVSSLIEDGGELVVLSVFAAFTAAHALPRLRARFAAA